MTTKYRVPFKTFVDPSQKSSDSHYNHSSNSGSQMFQGIKNVFGQVFDMLSGDHEHLSSSKPIHHDKRQTGNFNFDSDQPGPQNSDSWGSAELLHI
jgi:hypothetical protein